MACFKRNSPFSKIVLTRNNLFDSSYTSKHAFRLQKFCFKNKICTNATIDPVGDRNINRENADYNYSSLSRFFFLAGLVTFYGLYSSAIAYAEDSDEEKENIEETHRNKRCFVSKSRVSKLKNLERAREARTSYKQNQAEDNDDFEPPRKIETRSKQVRRTLHRNIYCFKFADFSKLAELSNYLILQQAENEVISGSRIVDLQVLRSDLKSCSKCQSGEYLVRSEN